MSMQSPVQLARTQLAEPMYARSARWAHPLSTQPHTWPASAQYVHLDGALMQWLVSAPFASLAPSALEVLMGRALHVLTAKSVLQAQPAATTVLMSLCPSHLMITLRHLFQPGKWPWWTVLPITPSMQWTVGRLAGQRRGVSTGSSKQVGQTWLCDGRLWAY